MHEDGHAAKDDLESFDKDTRAAAFDLGNHGHINVAVIQVTQNQAKKIPSNRRTSATQLNRRTKVLHADPRLK